MHLHTLKRRLETSIMRVSPARPNSGITLNGILACPRNVVRGDSNVVLHTGSDYAFTVEHPLAALRMSGVHDASVEGTEEKWEFSRPQHRAAYSLGLKPSSVFGNPEGTISGGIMELIAHQGIIDSGAEREEKTVAEKVTAATEEGGTLDIEPARTGTGLDLELYLATLGPLQARFDPEAGLKPDELKKRVGKSVTAFIKGPVEDALYHALGDLIGDLAGTGGIDNAYVKAKFMRRYHQLTMTAVMKMKLVNSI
jgi:hypothetical protein